MGNEKIVDQTEIYQHLRREWRAADKLPKPSKAPFLKWRSVKDLMTVAKPACINLTVDDEAVPNSAANVPGPSITLECQAGLEALNAGAEADDLAAGTSADTILDLLAEKPIPGADTMRSLAECSVDGSVEGQESTTVAGKKIWDGAAQKIKI